MAFRIAVAKRTDGDGMENVSDSNAEIPDEGHLTIANTCGGSPNKIASANLISMKPAVASSRKLSGSEKTKAPKFVPLEPYKAAVRPLIPNKKEALLHSKILDGTTVPRPILMSCSSDMTDEIEGKVVTTCNDNEDELKNLRLDNEELERELKRQNHINAELKTLLMAAVGEDMETRVNCLAEDKQHLAQKLIDTAKNLSTHHEQIEWLASQCEVWRSKFLASSVMVEELARWKATLSQKISDGECVMKGILNERRVVRQNLLELYGSLVSLRDSFDLLTKRACLKTSNLVDLSKECSSVANGLLVQLLGGVKLATLDDKLQQLPHFTDAENAANYMLKHPHPLNMIRQPDAACNAVVGAAVALHGQLYHQNNPPRIACCPQCTGQIKLV